MSYYSCPPSCPRRAPDPEGWGPEGSGVLLAQAWDSVGTKEKVPSPKTPGGPQGNLWRPGYFSFSPSDWGFWGPTEDP